MRLDRVFVRFIVASFACLACNPLNDRLKGEFNAGSADPFNYPPPYRGVGSNRATAGSGAITERRAFIANVETGYFAFPFSPSQITTTGYPPVATQYGASLNVDQFTPLIVSGLGADGTGSAVPLPLAYNFDPPGTNDPGPDSMACVPPAGYAYDPFRDDVHYDAQGNIFSVLPNATFNPGALPAWTYVPVVKEVPVKSNNEPCQDIKSEKSLKTRSDVIVPLGPPLADGTVPAIPDGRYITWALIDPGVPVFGRNDNPSTASGLGRQRFGWFQQFLVAYLDGGYVPTVPGPIVQGRPTTRMKTQRLFYPRQIGTATTGAGIGLGAGNDVLEFPRSDAASYTPVCQVISYMAPATGAPHDAATIISSFSATFQPPPAPPAGGAITPTFIFCLQVP